jgi:hypothetical protein
MISRFRDEEIADTPDQDLVPGFAAFDKGDGSNGNETRTSLRLITRGSCSEALPRVLRYIDFR